MAQLVKKPPANVGDIRDAGSILGREDPLKEALQSILIFLPGESPWTDEPGGLQKESDKTEETY